jgi:hypothetical protein
MIRRNARKATGSRNRAVQVAAAVAREAVQQLHVEHALALIRHGAGRFSELRMLEIYLRLLELSGPDGEGIANRVLASLGRAQSLHGTRVVSGMSSAQGEAHGAADDDVVADDHSLLRTLRRRLRGRVHDELRRTVELQVGVARTALLETHVRHARGFVELLAHTHTIADACGLYTAMVEMPPSHEAVLYMLVLDRIAAEESSATWAAVAQDAPSQPPREHRLPGRAAHRSRARTTA